MSSKLFFAGAVILAAAFALFGSRTPLAPVLHSAALRDRSLSDREGCKAYAGIVDQVIEKTMLQRNSTLFLAVTGDAGSADEPVEITAGKPPSPTGRSVDGPMAFAKARTAYLARVIESCNSAGQSTHSPIYLGVHRLVSHVRQLGDENSERLVWIQSDLEELAELAIKLALRNAKEVRYLDLPKIDNSGVEIRFCGAAETRGTIGGPEGKVILTRPRRLTSEERVIQVWTSLFTSPSNVSFTPFCPKWDGAVPQSAGE